MEAIEARGRASLALPGGTTPLFFLRALGRVDLDWARVRVTLTDERWVAPDHPRSNQRLVTETLLAGRASSARFVPFYRTGGQAAALAELEEDLTPLLPLDICVLGMGEDMHTASLFPPPACPSEVLEAALAEDSPPVISLTAGDPPERRVSLTAPVLQRARQIYLLIKGPAKRKALEQALAIGDPMIAPVALIGALAVPPVVFYAE